MLQDAADLITPISYFTPLSSSHSITRLSCWYLFFAWFNYCLSLFQRDVQLIWSLCLLLLVSRAPVHFSSSPQAVSCRRQLSPLAPLLPPGVEYPPPADKISRHWLHNWLLVASIMSSTRRIGLKPPLSQLSNNDCIIWDPMIYSKYFSGL